MTSFGKNPLFAACIAILLTVPCNCSFTSVVQGIRNRLRPLHGPNKYFCLFSDEECLSGRSRLCSDREPVCPGHCVLDYEVERLRTYSPYEFCMDRDVNRFPENIVQARCLCGGCHNGVSESHEMHSLPIQVDMDVVQLNQTSSVQRCLGDHHCPVKTMRLTVGCHCTLPFLEQS